MRRALVLVSVLVAVLVASLAGGRPLARLGAQDATPADGAGFVGSWRITVAPDASAGRPPWPALATFGADGTMVAAGTPVILAPPGAPFPKVVASTGQGTWEATGPQSVAFTFDLLLSEEGGTAYAVVTVRGIAELDAGGDAWAGEYSATIVGMLGRTLSEGHGMLSGTRIGVEPMAMPAAGTPAAATPAG
jgi:hypothetical protein